MIAVTILLEVCPAQPGRRQVPSPVAGKPKLPLTHNLFTRGRDDSLGKRAAAAAKAAGKRALSFEEGEALPQVWSQLLQHSRKRLWQGREELRLVDRRSGREHPQLASRVGRRRWQWDKEERARESRMDSVVGGAYWLGISE